MVVVDVMFEGSSYIRCEKWSVQNELELRLIFFDPILQPQSQTSENNDSFR